ncbi:M20 aminoacylase family protein [Prosthecomicrobium pneumaticum]|uniref:Hippurate hydrolase n=1 Tax=Prosthecomicrobium pneumaticum TaxID=81895 RepID=A0A7W9CTL0_9HYPH|nr:M20 aminoacylase family protein [Prosthecomicrobium pneumaticum]MBB5751411.1 hippurate hydrolase [Prosthecomicrobium pneumaticum]
MPIRNRIAELQDEIAAWRRDIHAHPELMYDTIRTSAFVAEKLREFGCDSVVEGIGRTGVVGVVKGRSDSRGHVVGLRADMDALPILEATGLDYASTTPGKMHACGHDGHTAMLLGAAKHLAETRNFDGTVAFIFQPAEEGGAGGEAMVKDGLIERFAIREVYGMHNQPGLPVGAFSIRTGAFFAATDSFSIVVIGKGGHAAKPHVTIDTTIIASHIVLALQSIAARNADPLKSIVVSVTSFRTESEAYNVIPERVELRGTVRTFDPALRALAEERLTTIAQVTAQAFGGRAEVDWQRGYPAMVNAAVETDHARAAAQKVAGRPAEDASAIMGGEDFAYMLEACPGAYIMVGNGDTADVHHPLYNFNDDAIPFGSSYWVELVESRMPAG